jgi:hypothetical protein
MTYAWKRELKGLAAVLIANTKTLAKMAAIFANTRLLERHWRQRGRQPPCDHIC